MNSVSLLNVLLVEDSPDDVYFFNRAITKSGVPAAVQVVSDGVEAMNYLRRQGKFADPKMFAWPNVIFLDLKLPHLNGFEFLESLHQADIRAPLIVVLTSSDQPSDHVKARALGASFYWIKPATEAQLREFFERLLIPSTA